MNKRIEVLDSFRGIAALLVLIYHFTHKSFHIGVYGVHFFFIISGFVIFLSIEKVSSVYEFATKRFIRLFPAFLICMSLTTLAIILFPDYSNDSVTLKRYLINLTMVPEVFGQKPMDTSYWSLIPEILFYAFMCIIIMFNFKNKIILIINIWLLLIIGFLFIPSSYQFDAFRLLNLKHGQLFIAGIIFYKIFNESINLKYISILLITYVINLISYPQYYPVLYKNPLHFIVITIIYLLFILFIFQKLNFLNLYVLKLLGQISYPLYLIHQVVGLTLINLLSKNTYLNPILIFTFALVFTLALAYIIQEHLEKRLIKYLKRTIN